MIIKKYQLSIKKIISTWVLIKTLHTFSAVIFQFLVRREANLNIKKNNCTRHERITRCINYYNIRKIDHYFMRSFIITSFFFSKQVIVMQNVT